MHFSGYKAVSGEGQDIEVTSFIDVLHVKQTELIKWNSLFWGQASNKQFWDKTEKVCARFGERFLMSASGIIFNKTEILQDLWYSWMRRSLLILEVFGLRPADGRSFLVQ